MWISDMAVAHLSVLRIIPRVAEIEVSWGQLPSIVFIYTSIYIYI